MPIKLNSTGGGSITLDAPSTASNYTLTFPAQNGTPITTLPSTAGNVLTSDGTNWVSQAPSVATGTIIAYGASTPPSGYLLCDGSTYTKSSYTALSTVLGSLVGNTYTRTTTGYNNGMVSVANDRIFGNGIAAFSADSGATWSATNAGASYTGKVFWTGSRYVTGRNGYVAQYSTNATSWTAVSLAGMTDNPMLAYSGSRFVAVNQGNTSTAYSTDGVTWSAGGTLTGFAGAKSIAYGASIFVAVGNGSSVGKISTSTDGTSWTARTVPAGFGASNVTVVDFLNNLFVAQDSLGNVASSSDGTTWTLKYTQTISSPIRSVSDATYDMFYATYVAGRYWMRGAYSTDLVTWTPMPIAAAYYQSGIAQSGTYAPNPFCTGMATDGTRIYTGNGTVYNPQNYTTATQFIVPNLSQYFSDGVYYHIKT